MTTPEHIYYNYFMEAVTLQGYKHQRAKVISKWVRIIRHYEEHGAKATYTKFGISRSGLYYIIGEMNKENAVPTQP